MQAAVTVQNYSPAFSRNTSIAVFNDWYDIVPADTPELLDHAYRLRYQVYCRERCYEESGAFPDQREIDRFDNRSVHSLVVSRIDDSCLGTVRLVFPDVKNPDNCFPMQQICRNFRADRLRPLCFQTTAEISRFAISKMARKLTAGIDDSIKSDGLQSTVKDRIARPSVVLGLMKAIVRMSREHGITDWLAVMEPSLLRLLARYGIFFQPIGPLVDFHGMRQPCQANLDKLLARVRQECPEVWEFVVHDICP